MFPFLFAFFGSELWNNIFGSVSNVSGMSGNNSKGKYVDGGYVDDLLLDVIGKNEGKNSFAVEKAYLLKGENKYTIGYGTTYLYSTLSCGNFRGDALVRSTDTLTSLKVLMGHSNMTSEQFARQLISNHIRCDYNFNKGGYKKFVKLLDDSGLVYNRNLNVGLIDIGYMSGSFFGSSKASDLQILFKMNQGNNKKIAFVLFKSHFEYLRGLSNYNVNKIGWTKRLLKRYFLVAYGEFRHDYVEKYLSTVNAIKNYCFSEMGYIINL